MRKLKKMIEWGNPLLEPIERGTPLLDPQNVQGARAEEMQIFAEMGVYEHLYEQAFQADPHARLIGTTWADCDKGTPGRRNPSRVVSEMTFSL